MKLWMRKIFVFLVAVMTLGMYIPTTHVNTVADSDSVVSEKSKEDVEHSTPPVSINRLETEDKLHPDSEKIVDDHASLMHVITNQAKEQAISKLGPRILDQVEDEVITNILPTLEEVLETLLVDAGDEELHYYGITEQPTPGYGERIFHLYDFRTKNDIAKFHVRRDNRPGEGYWFNFHYHLNEDGFEDHHTIGEIYWNKNTPPKWMS
ncbi:YpjP family protein [Aquibacillus albus]|uniref:YpjP-like protein n=1 Tax=Aquibacillus albus TaxID=1168171 RepID=A0ABS2MZC9_9BACI|nr:YpjP family protein [Aquibacillus albus]MBM7571227.1 hypothetical protein [Aquibacillus albus]